VLRKSLIALALIVVITFVIAWGAFAAGPPPFVSGTDVW
jgi:hypothetical protein